MREARSSFNFSTIGVHPCKVLVPRCGYCRVRVFCISSHLLVEVFRFFEPEVIFLGGRPFNGFCYVGAKKSGAGGEREKGGKVCHLILRFLVQFCFVFDAFFFVFFFWFRAICKWRCVALREKQYCASVRRICCVRQKKRGLLMFLIPVPLYPSHDSFYHSPQHTRNTLCTTCKER